MEFVVLPFKEYKDVYILRPTEEIQANLDDSNISIQTIASSRYVGPIKSRVEEWLRQLEMFSKTMVSRSNMEKNCNEGNAINAFFNDESF